MWEELGGSRSDYDQVHFMCLYEILKLIKILRPGGMLLWRQVDLFEFEASIVYMVGSSHRDYTVRLSPFSQRKYILNNTPVKMLRCLH